MRVNLIHHVACQDLITVHQNIQFAIALALSDMAIMDIIPPLKSIALEVFHVVIQFSEILIEVQLNHANVNNYK